MEPEPYLLEFMDNHLLSLLVGPQDHHLAYLEKKLGVSLAMRGNRITVHGNEPAIRYAAEVLNYLYEQLQKGAFLDTDFLDHSLQVIAKRFSENVEQQSGTLKKTEISIVTKRRIVFPRTPNQAAYIESMQHKELVFGIGPAGTGKTYLAVAQAVSFLLEGKVDRIILSRPAVEAGESLGFLPGDMKEKVDPYLRPLYDSLHDMLPPDQVPKRIANGEIEIAPIAFMRGRTLGNAFVILDEAQNTTEMQMKMLLTRLGPHSRMVINGDLTQIDLPRGVPSGLKNAKEILKNIADIDFIFFDERDVVRHPLVAKIVHAYDRYDKKNRLPHES